MTNNEPRLPSVYGPGTFTDQTFVPIPEDTTRIFRLLAALTPGFTRDEALLAKAVFEGDAFPVLPGPIKSVSVGAALHAMIGVVADEILALRGAGNPDRRITVNTTHTAVWFGNVAAAFLDGEDMLTLSGKRTLGDVVPDFEKGWVDTPLKFRGTGIYPTKDKDAWYCVHGSLDVPPVLRALGIDPDQPGIETLAQAAELIAAHARKWSSQELEMNNITHGFCGSICFTPQAWADSSMGKALAAHPLIHVESQPWHTTTAQPITPFAPFTTPDRRPLVGIRVLELTRVIAGPQIGTYLAALGAEVIRVNAPHLRDVNLIQLTLNAGKRTLGLDLRDPADRACVQDLAAQADVFIQGFRLDKLRTFGLGKDKLFAMAARRGRGLVYVAENCYGPDGPYAARPGWQQIADCASGAAYVMGRGQRLDGGECVLPSLPISDMSTGAVAVVGTLLALRDRATRGGSYGVHAALTAVDVFALREDVGLYPPEVVAACQERFQWDEMRAAHHVADLLATVWKGWKRVLPEYLDEDGGWYSAFDGSAFQRKRLSILKPVLRFSDEESTPRWTSGSVPNAQGKRGEVDFQRP